MKLELMQLRGGDLTLAKPTKCGSCGACCATGTEGRVPFAVGERVPDFYIREHAATTETPGASCPWHDPDAVIERDEYGTCLYYDKRPNICRSERWKIGGHECMSVRFNTLQKQQSKDEVGMQFSQTGV